MSGLLAWADRAIRDPFFHAYALVNETPGLGSATFRELTMDERRGLAELPCSVDSLVLFDAPLSEGQLERLRSTQT